MLNKYSKYQHDGFEKLIKYKNSFKTDGKKPGKTSQDHLIKLRQQESDFIDLFCIHDLADTDYASIQNEPQTKSAFKEWADKCVIEDILKTITFFIWTDKSIDHYFHSKINDGSIYALLVRLEMILKEKFR